MSANFIARIVGMIFFAILGGIFGYRIGLLSDDQVTLYTTSITLIGALVGLVLTPYFTTIPERFIRNKLTRLSAEALLASLFGLIAGL
ncbi:MAG: PIN domain nuclease, partial [Chloroflexota bacterium]